MAVKTRGKKLNHLKKIFLNSKINTKLKSNKLSFEI